MVAVSDIIESQSGNHAIIGVLDQLPVSIVAIAVFSLVALIFSATTYDSASYAPASVATLFLKAGDEPARWHRVFWAFAIGLLPETFMFIGGIKLLQTTLLVVSLPILVVGVVMSVSLMKSLGEDYPVTKNLVD